MSCPPPLSSSLGPGNKHRQIHVYYILLVSDAYFWWFIVLEGTNVLGCQTEWGAQEVLSNRFIHTHQQSQQVLINIKVLSILLLFLHALSSILSKPLDNSCWIMFLHAFCVCLCAQMKQTMMWVREPHFSLGRSELLDNNRAFCHIGISWSDRVWLHKHFLQVWLNIFIGLNWNVSVSVLETTEVTTFSCWMRFKWIKMLCWLT